MKPVFLVLILSVIFTIGGIGLIRKAIRLKRAGRRAVATVVRIRHSKDDEGNDECTPVVEFLTEKQETINIELSYGNTAKPKRIGEKIDILYDPNNPEEVEVNSFLRLDAGPWLFLTIGVASLVLAVLEILGITNVGMMEWEFMD